MALNINKPIFEQADESDVRLTGHGAMQIRELAPRPGDIIFLIDGSGFLYVGEPPRDAHGRFLPVPALGDGCFEIVATSGEAFIVARAPERDAELRSAVHDDGRRRAWRANVALRLFSEAESAALDHSTAEA